MNHRMIVLYLILGILLLSIMSDPVKAAYTEVGDSVTRQESVTVNHDPELNNVTNSRLTGTEIIDYNIADPASSLNYSNKRTWDEMCYDENKMRELFGMDDINYSYLNFELAGVPLVYLLHSNTTSNYIVFTPPFEKVDYVKIWMARGNNGINGSLEVCDRPDGNIMLSQELNDSMLPLFPGADPICITVWIHQHSETGMMVIGFNGTGIIFLSADYWGSGSGVGDYDVQPEFKLIDDLNNTIPYIMQVAASGTKILDGVWLGSDLPPNVVRMANYSYGDWANIVQYVTFSSTAIATGGSSECIRLPLLFSWALEYNFTIYEVDSVKMAKPIYSGIHGNISLNSLSHPVMIANSAIGPLGVSNWTGGTQGFFTYTSFIGGKAYNFVYLLLHTPLYPGKNYVFVSSARNYYSVIPGIPPPDDYIPKFMLSITDLFNDKMTFSYINSNSTNMQQIPMEPDLSMKIMSGMSGGITGYVFDHIMDYNHKDYNMITWVLDMGHSTAPYDELSIVIPVELRGDFESGRNISVEIWWTARDRHSPGTVLEWGYANVENLSDKYILFSRQILHSTADDFIQFTLLFYSNYSNQQGSVGLWLVDPHIDSGSGSVNYTTTLSPYRLTQSLITNPLFHPDYQRAYYDFIPYSYNRWTDGILQKVNLSGYTFMTEIDFMKWYNDTQASFNFWDIVEGIWNLACSFVGWLFNDVIMPGIYTLMSNIPGLLPFLAWIGSMAIMFAEFMMWFVTVVIPAIVDFATSATAILLLVIAGFIYFTGCAIIFKFLRGLELLVTSGSAAMVDYYTQFTDKMKTTITAIASKLPKVV